MLYILHSKIFTGDAHAKRRRNLYFVRSRGSGRKRNAGQRNSATILDFLDQPSFQRRSSRCPPPTLKRTAWGKLLAHSSAEWWVRAPDLVLAARSPAWLCQEWGQFSQPGSEPHLCSVLPAQSPEKRLGIAPKMLWIKAFRATMCFSTANC